MLGPVLTHVMPPAPSGRMLATVKPQGLPIGTYRALLEGLEPPFCAFGEGETSWDSDGARRLGEAAGEAAHLCCDIGARFQ